MRQNSIFAIDCGRNPDHTIRDHNSDHQHDIDNHSSKAEASVDIHNGGSGVSGE